MNLALAIRRLRGLDFTGPQVGQIWRSGHSGRYMRVADVSLCDSGGFIVYVQYWREAFAVAHPTHPWGMEDLYCVGIDNWRACLREEKRQLVSAGDPAWEGEQLFARARMLAVGEQKAEA